MFTTTAVEVGASGGIQLYEGENQTKQMHRAQGNQPKPPNTMQPDEAQLVAQGHAQAGNGRGGTVLAPPMGMNPLAPMPNLGLGASPTAKTTTGA